MKQSTVVIIALGAVLLLFGSPRFFIPKRPTQRVDVNEAANLSIIEQATPNTVQGIKVKRVANDAEKAERAAERKAAADNAKKGIVNRVAVDSALDYSTSPTSYFTDGPAMGW